MDKQAITTFTELLDRQASGDAAVIDDLRQLSFSLDHGYCLYNLYLQWSGAFSYLPGRTESLTPILELARKLQSFSRDDTLKMYEQPEWKQIVDLRGPVEVVQIYRCDNCRADYPAMGTSGFLDIAGLVCPKCGDVYFKSYYHESATPKCACGGSYPSPEHHGCPSCGNSGGKVVKEISPFQYFGDHKYTYDA